MRKENPTDSYATGGEGLLYDIPAADTVLSPINFIEVFRLSDYKRIPKLVAYPAANSLQQTHLRTPVGKTHFPA